jgi:hypothetical protein
MTHKKLNYLHLLKGSSWTLENTYLKRKKGLVFQSQKYLNLSRQYHKPTGAKRAVLVEVSAVAAPLLTSSFYKETSPVNLERKMDTVRSKIMQT